MVQDFLNQDIYMNSSFVHKTKNKTIPRGACKTCQEDNQKVGL